MKTSSSPPDKSKIIALFSLSLFAFVLVMMTFDLDSLPAHFSDNLPRGWIAGLLFFTAAFLSLAWLGRILPTLALDSLSLWERGGVRGIPALENTTSMFIQVMDLGILVPVYLLAGILLLRRKPWGYLLASVGLMKFLTMGTAVSVMALNMARLGLPVSAVKLVVFPLIAIANLVMVTLLLINIVTNYPDGYAAPTRRFRRGKPSTNRVTNARIRRVQGKKSLWQAGFIREFVVSRRGRSPSFAGRLLRNIRE